jgi:peroxiredoxin
VTSCATDAPPQTGAKAPDFELYDTSGKAVRLSDYKGQAVLINFWDTDCTYCVEEMPLLQQAFEQESAAADGVVMLTINIRPAPNHRRVS